MPVSIKGDERVTGVGHHVTDLRKQSLFGLIDSDNSGQIDKAEFDELYDVIKQQTEKDIMDKVAIEKKATQMKRRLRLTMCVLFLAFFFLGLSVAANCAVTFYLLESSKETHETNGMLTADDNTVVAVREAVQGLPLIVAPLLEQEELNKVKTITVKRYADDDHDGEWDESYQIIGYEWSSEIEMSFRTSWEKTELVISMGAVFTQPHGNKDPFARKYVCANNADCASFTAEGVDVGNATALANEAIELVRVANINQDPYGEGGVGEDMNMTEQQDENDPNWIDPALFNLTVGRRELLMTAKRRQLGNKGAKHSGHAALGAFHHRSGDACSSRRRSLEEVWESYEKTHDTTQLQADYEKHGRQMWYVPSATTTLVCPGVSDTFDPMAYGNLISALRSFGRRLDEDGNEKKMFGYSLDQWQKLFDGTETRGANKRRLLQGISNKKTWFKKGRRGLQTLASPQRGRQLWWTQWQLCEESVWSNYVNHIKNNVLSYALQCFLLYSDWCTSTQQIIQGSSWFLAYQLVYQVQQPNVNVDAVLNQLQFWALFE